MDCEGAKGMCGPSSPADTTAEAPVHLHCRTTKLDLIFGPRQSDRPAWENAHKRFGSHWSPKSSSGIGCQPAQLEAVEPNGSRSTARSSARKAAPPTTNGTDSFFFGLVGPLPSRGSPPYFYCINLS